MQCPDIWMNDLLDEGDDDDECFFALAFHRPETLRKKHGGSAANRSPNKRRDPHGRHDRLILQYFCDNPIYSSDDFRRRYRMSIQLFNRVLDAVCVNDLYFQQRRDATGKLGISGLLKVTAAIRMLAYGSSADSVDENLEMGEQTVLDSLQHFVQSVIHCFGDEYLRPPSEVDITRLLEMNARRGFIGMLGSIDCMHWQWKNCPAALAGQLKGKEKKPTLVLEAWADEELWIWHCNFGSPGSLNDLNILDRSPIFQNLLAGKAPAVKFTLNDTEYDMAYFLADGIYPDWPVFIKSMEHPKGKKNSHFCERQEACRKDVERAFGVLQARWCIISTPCRLWSSEAMNHIIKACVILHNMVVEDERDTSTSIDELLCESHELGGASTFTVTRPRNNNAELKLPELITAFRYLHNTRLHAQLRSDLIEHLWNLNGQ